MRLFYLTYFSQKFEQESPVTVKSETASRISLLGELRSAFPLSWSHYVMLVKRTRSPEHFLEYDIDLGAPFMFYPGQLG